ncbi:MAG: hypothetical protein IT225_04345 [Flavobacteriales bacterium]|jgi:hypothetical protein|nr:hypothetical protein [Flavobacteriales bacterium]
MRRAILFAIALLHWAVLTAQERPEQRSEHGWYLSPHGTIRILVLFVEIDFDVTPGKDPQPNGAEHWPKGKLPTWKDRVFDPFPMAVQQAEVSRYYQDISLGRYTVLGDHIDTLITLKESEYPGVHQAHSIGIHAVKEANKRGKLRTRHGLGISDFDLWKVRGRAGEPKLAGPDDPHSYDHVMVIVRNSGLGHGAGSTDSGSPGELYGFRSDTQSRFGAMYALPFEILKHEFNHLLIGGNNFHSGGGNAAQFESTFMPLQGGWSMMGASGSSLLTCSAWDRDRMGWRPDGAVHRIRARDMAGNEVDADLDPLAGDTGIFVLRDFVPTGDALRIRMPFIPEDRTPQWLWIENHQGSARNGSPTDRFHWEGINPCVTGMDPGLFMTMQVGREDRTGPAIFNGSADYLRPVLANGNYDLHLRGDTLHNSCPFGTNTLYFVRDPDLANPLTGNHEQELPVHDRDHNGTVQRTEHWVPGVRTERGEPDADLILYGRPDHAFRMNGVRSLGMCTNPSSANMLTLYSTNTRETYGRKAPNVRTIHLNGIRVDLLEMRTNGEAVVRISTNDTRMVSDQRWCADSITLPPLRGTDGHSLTITSGVHLLLDRSRTPTRMSDADTSDGGPWFSDPTTFTVQTGASVLVEPRSTLELRNNSTMHLMPGSQVEFARKARLIVPSGSRIVVHGDARLEGRAKHFRKARRQGRIITLQ